MVKKKETDTLAAKVTTAEVKEEKAVAKKAPAKKPAAKKAPVKKEVAEVVPEPVKPATSRVKAVVKIQYAGKNYSTEELTAMAKEYWCDALGYKASAFKKPELYIKTEESKVYLVVNGTPAGAFDI